MAAVAASRGNVGRVVQKLFARVSRDDYNRGIGRFAAHFKDDLNLSAQAIAQHNVHHVGIITGFPCLMQHAIPTETDGPLGALALARALLLMGKSVTVITDDCNSAVVRACRDFSAPPLPPVDGGDVTAPANGAAEEIGAALLEEEQRLLSHVQLLSFPAGTSWSAAQEDRLAEVANSLDHVIAIERTGPAPDGTYRTMRCFDMSHLVAPLERILTLHTRRGVRSMRRAKKEGRHTFFACTLFFHFIGIISRLAPSVIGGAHAPPPSPPAHAHAPARTLLNPPPPAFML
jgi:hypothetical protein